VCSPSTPHASLLHNWASVTVGVAIKMVNDTTGVFVLAPESLNLQAETQRFSCLQRLHQKLAFLWALPWWLISLLLHALLILLVGLVSFAAGLPEDADIVVLRMEFAAHSDVRLDAGDGRDAGGGETQGLAHALLGNATLEARSDTSDKELLVEQDTERLNAITDRLPDNASKVAESEVIAGPGAAGESVLPSARRGSVYSDPERSVAPAPRSTFRGYRKGGAAGLGLGEIRRVDGRDSWAGDEPITIGGFRMRTVGGREETVKRHGGNAETEDAVNKGLEWLARNQKADGYWEPAAGAQLGRREDTKIAVTGLAALAFLTAGHTEKAGKYAPNVKKAIQWLRNQQDSKGKISNSNYNHSIAGMALAEAAGMSGVKETVDAAQRAVDASCALRMKSMESERSGWSYNVEQMTGTSFGGDMSNSGWTIMFLKSAKTAGLRVPENSIEGITRYLNACEYRENKKDPYTGHRYCYVPIARLRSDKDAPFRGAAMVTPRCTAIGILCRLFFGTPVNELEGGAQYMVDHGGYPDACNGDAPGLGGRMRILGHDLYYIYYATLIQFQMGGQGWKKWNEALQRSLLPRQVKAGPNAGSWDPEGMYSADWGRAGETALSVLCLEVYYRYQRAN